MISGINLDTKSVTVEWYENGETKGKEVRFMLLSYFYGSFIVLWMSWYTLTQKQTATC